MATVVTRSNTFYGYPNPQGTQFPDPIVANRAPTQADKAVIGQLWVYPNTNSSYILSSINTSGQSVWTVLNIGGAGVFSSLQVNGNVTQTAGVTTLLATTTAGLTNNGNFVNNTGAVTINPSATPVTSSLTVIGQNTVTQPTGTFAASVAGNHNAVQFVNQNAASTGTCEITVITTNQDAGAGRVGDAQIRFADTAFGGFTLGRDASASDFVISQGAVLGTNDRLTIDGATGAVNLPAQPAFRAVRTADTGAVTGDNTNYDVIFQSTQYNIGACYTAGTGVFQAPIAGRYLLSANIIVDNIAAGMTSATVGFWDGAQYIGTQIYMNPVPVLIGGGTYFSFPINTIIGLAALANINVRVNLAGGALAATIPANITCFFAAELLG